MSKYYTPEIEEFRIGFEYEWLQEDKTWLKASTPIEISVEGYAEQSYGLRVKYLDREDIESLGGVKWVDQDDNIYDLGDLQLHFGVFTNPLVLVIYNDASDMVYKGIIRNKSELKTLVKQVELS